MIRKHRTLNPEDRRAVDLLLDQGLATGGVTRVSAGASRPRVDAAARVLALLGTLDPIPVPVDLVSRTLQRIEDHRSPTTMGIPMTPSALLH